MLLTVLSSLSSACNSLEMDGAGVKQSSPNKNVIFMVVELAIIRLFGRVCNECMDVLFIFD
jgi:hypothetical protein